MPKEHLAYISSLMGPLMVLVTAGIARITSGPKPLNIALASYPWRIACSLAAGALIGFYPPHLITNGGMGQFTFYGLVLVLMGAQGVLMTVMFTAQMSFFARISDPAIGGTYMVRERGEHAIPHRYASR